MVWCGTLNITHGHRGAAPPGLLLLLGYQKAESLQGVWLQQPITERALEGEKVQLFLSDALCHFRANHSERSGNQGAKTEDCRSDGSHAQHNVHRSHQHAEPRFPTLLFQICGDQPFRTWSQCLCLSAHEEMNANSGFARWRRRAEGFTQERLLQSKMKLYCVRLLFVVIKNRKKKKKKEHLDRLELPIRFSCKFLEDLTELCNLFSLANALKTILGFQVANFAFLCTCAWFPLENTGLCLILNPFFSLLFFFLTIELNLPIRFVEKQWGKNLLFWQRKG